jgi:hypothetical protein
LLRSREVDLKGNARNEIEKKMILTQSLNSRNTSNELLDPHETKLIKALTTVSNRERLTVEDINLLLNLKKLSKENQRQRRHIIIKELNLKLFLMTGVRESIIRVASHSDKRVKSYTLVPEILNNNKIKEVKSK